MAIIHLHTPESNVSYPHKRDPLVNWMRDELLKRKAQVELCPPGFFGNITPPTFRKLMLKGASVWLQVDEEGEKGAIISHSGLPGVPPVVLKPTEIAGVRTIHREEVQPISAVENPSAAIITPTGKGLAQMHNVGGLILHSSHPAAAPFCEQFQLPEPPMSDL